MGSAFSLLSFSAILLEVSSLTTQLALGLVGAGLCLQLSCRAPHPATPPPAPCDCQPVPSTVPAPASGSSHTVTTKATSHGAAAEDRPLQRCFAEDTALSPPRSLSVLLARSADLFEQAIQHQNRGLHSPANSGTSGGSGKTKASSAPATTAAKSSTVTQLQEAALACADEALRIEGRSVEAHHNRGLALQELGLLDQAQAAFTHALAIDPSDPETLAAAAELFINVLPPSDENTAIGMEYARRGKQLLQRSLASAASTSRALARPKPHGRSRETHTANLDSERAAPAARPSQALLARLLLLEGQGLKDLGQVKAALGRLDEAIANSQPGHGMQARFERALTLFELCRFAEAQTSFQQVLQHSPGDGWAHYNLGLVYEMQGKQALAEQEFAQAQQLVPDAFPPLLAIGPAEFRALVEKEVQALSKEQQAVLRQVSLQTVDLPDVSDLVADDPPLAPTILGMFRGTPLPPQSIAVAKHPPAAHQRPEKPVDNDERTIFLYRKNLLRAVLSPKELTEQIRTTLLHELGHLRGEDDAELTARGLQ